MLGERRFPRSCVRGKASGVVTLLITEALCSSFTPHMSGREITWRYHAWWCLEWVPSGQNWELGCALQVLWWSSWGWSLALAVLFSPLVSIREIPEFHEVNTMDKGLWPRCLLWHGWLPVVSFLGRDQQGCCKESFGDLCGCFSCSDLVMLGWC